MSKIFRATIPAGSVELPKDEAPDTPDGAYLIARRYNDEGRPTDALQMLRRALEMDNRHEDSIVELGSTLMDIGRRNDATKFFSDALEAHPTLAAVRLAFANCLLRLDRVEDAVVQLEECVNIRPTWEAGFSPLIVALCRSNRVEDARARLEQLRGFSSNTATLEMLSRLIERTSDLS